MARILARIAAAVSAVLCLTVAVALALGSEGMAIPVIILVAGAAALAVFALLPPRPDALGPGLDARRPQSLESVDR